MTHKQWLDNEYQQWIKALQESTVDNFKEHPVVRRMLSLDLWVDYEEPDELFLTNFFLPEVIGCIAINQIGYCKTKGGIDNSLKRMIYYAQKVLAQTPSSICEIGGGVGQFYAILRALGYKGQYAMYDLPEVLDFQLKYLKEVGERTGLECPVTEHENSNPNWFCVSFYAFGEFDDKTKQWYIENVISKCEHGMIVFNPHSGASDYLPFQFETQVVQDEYPLTSPGNKFITW